MQIKSKFLNSTWNIYLLKIISVNICVYFINCIMNYKTFHLLYRLIKLNASVCIDFYHSELKNIHMSEWKMIMEEYNENILLAWESLVIFLDWIIECSGSFDMIQQMQKSVNHDSP